MNFHGKYHLAYRMVTNAHVTSIARIVYHCCGSAMFFDLVFFNLHYVLNSALDVAVLPVTVIGLE